MFRRLQPTTGLIRKYYNSPLSCTNLNRALSTKSPETDKCPGTTNRIKKIKFKRNTLLSGLYFLLVSFEDISRALYRIQPGIIRTVCKIFSFEQLFFVASLCIFLSECSIATHRSFFLRFATVTSTSKKILRNLLAHSKRGQKICNLNEKYHKLTSCLITGVGETLYYYYPRR